MYTCIILVLFFGGNLIAVGGMATGELISFISYITQILMSLMFVSFIMITGSRALASSERIKEVLKTDIDLNDDVDVAILTPETAFRKVEGWTSLVALMIITMIDEEYGVVITGDEMKTATSLQELYNLVASKL